MQKVIGFIGYVDKSEFLINLSKIMHIMRKRVLVVDGTSEHRIKYTIPSFDTAMDETITNFDGTDFAVGFKSIEDIKKYICTKTSIADDYDYILIDIDNKENFEYFKDENISKYFFFIEHSTISLIKNGDLIRHITQNYSTDKLEFTKIVFKNYISRASQKYFEARLIDMNIKWLDSEYELIYNEQDKIAALESELSGYIDFSRHTKQYMTLITDIASEILDGIMAGEIRKTVKNYSRRKF